MLLCRDGDITNGSCPDLTGTLFHEKTHLFENIEWVYVFVPIHIALLTQQVSLSLQWLIVEFYYSWTPIFWGPLYFWD
jgi:hypothetical protein